MTLFFTWYTKNKLSDPPHNNSGAIIEANNVASKNKQSLLNSATSNSCMNKVKTLPGFGRNAAASANLESSLAHSEPYCNRIVIVNAGQSGNHNHVPANSSPGGKSHGIPLNMAADTTVTTGLTKTTCGTCATSPDFPSASVSKHAASESRLCGQEPVLRISVPFRNNPLLRHNWIRIFLQIPDLKLQNSWAHQRLCHHSTTKTWHHCQKSLSYKMAKIRKQQLKIGCGKTYR